MVRTLVLALVAASASAFSAPRMGLEGMAGISNEVGGGVMGKSFTNTAVWDPLGFGSLSDTVKGEHGGVMPHAKWLREAELKHGRGAMLAFVGTCVAINGVHFPGEMGGNFYESGPWADGLTSALATNPFGMAQLLLSIALVEGTSYSGDFWSGGGAREAGDLGFYPFGKGKGRDMDKMKLSELKNGRLAMIAMAGFFAEHQIDGSVPFLSDAV